jgi:photosystem II stability/assembly factor-like uncharacterized protein
MRFFILAIGMLIPLFLNAEEAKAPFHERGLWDDYSDAPKQVHRQLFRTRARAYPFDRIPEGARTEAIDQRNDMLHKMKKYNSSLLGEQTSWRQLGPDNIGGRVRGIAVHPTDPNTVWIAAASGGIWKTTNGGGTWASKFDYKSTVSMGSIAVDPNNPDILFAGTGEGANTQMPSGTGMYKSTDGGETWKLSGLTGVQAFNKTFIHPEDSNLILAGGWGGKSGVYRSKDGGDSWERLNKYSVTDMSIHPRNPNEFIIGVDGGALITKDMGKTFKSIISPESQGGLPINSIGRVSIQYSQLNTNVIFALIEAETERRGFLYYSENRGVSWNRSTIQGSEIFFSGGNPQGWYDNVIAVHPTEPKTVLAGGVSLKRTENGLSFADYTAGIHPDQQCVTFSPSSPDIVYLGGDGGMYRSSNAGKNFSRINKGLEITQFYGFSTQQRSKMGLVGGTQDNNTIANIQNTDNWNALLGGDGFETRLDNDNEDIVYGQSQYGNISWVNMKTGGGQYIANGLPQPRDGTNSLFGAPLEQAYLFPAIMHGGKSLWMNSNPVGNSAWFQVGTFVTDDTEFISSIEASKTDGDFIAIGTNAGKFLVFSNAGSEITDFTEGLPGRFITDIETSFGINDLVYVTVSGYGNPHVFKSADAGETWENISSNLPDVPVNQITLNKNNEENLYVATDIGVFATFNSGATWFPVGEGLPNVSVSDIEIYYNEDGLQPNKMLRAATYGRSIWELDLPQEPDVQQDIITPMGGEVYVSGTEEKFQWYGIDLPVKLEISYDDGAKWERVGGDINSNQYSVNLKKRETDFSMIRVSSVDDPSQVAVSNYFAIELKDKGSVLASAGFNHVPYGIALDKDGNMWTSSFYSGFLFKFNPETWELLGKYELTYDEFYTGLGINPENGNIYISRLESSGATGGYGNMEIRASDGSFVDYIPHPIQQTEFAPNAYVIGTVFKDGKLYLGERNNNKILEVNPKDMSILNVYDSPCQDEGGPRGLGIDEDGNLLHVCTSFPGNQLTDVNILVLDKDDITKIIDQMKVEDSQGLINARGVTLDPGSTDLWVSEFGGQTGSIYKIAGFNTTKDIDPTSINSKNYLSGLDVEIFPNPARELANVSFNSGEYSGRFRVVLTDLTGRQLAVPFDDNVGKNNVKPFSIQTDKLMSGSYNLVFHLNGNVIGTEKFIKVE